MGISESLPLAFVILAKAESNSMAQSSTIPVGADSVARYRIMIWYMMINCEKCEYGKNIF
jgi:hypothetical protein